jgi:tetratricopeptide (TPR) repeat protein
MDPIRPIGRPHTTMPAQAPRLGAVLLAMLLCGAAPQAWTQSAAPADLAQVGHAAHGDHAVDYPVGCKPDAQAQFNLGLTQLHHMTYPPARASFESAAATDPGCAMAHWGIAMTLFQPLWPSRPDAQALQRGWEQTQRAKALAGDAPHERLLIAAAEAFFLEPAGTDYWQRIARWEAAMAKAHAASPGDHEIAVFYALSQLATAPSDKVTRSNADAAAAILLQVHERQPDHPGVMHYLIHANDVPGREDQQLQVTRQYESTAPDNAHALHMPTHIYTRLGDWQGVVRGNLRSADAALKQPADSGPGKVSDEYAHALEYLVYAYLQQGADAEAEAQVRALHNTAALDPSFKSAFHLASIQARVALERHDWRQAAAIEPGQSPLVQWEKFPWPEAISQFAHGLGAARLGQLAAAQKAHTRLSALEEKTGGAGEKLFARNIGVLRLALEAWIARAQDQPEQAVALMRQAAELEAATPKHAVTPGPTLPAEEQLGDLLMQRGASAEALEAYRASLARYPNRFNSLLGAARAAEALQDFDAATGYYRTLLEIAPNSTRQVMQDVRRYVALAKR